MWDFVSNLPQFVCLSACSLFILVHPGAPSLAWYLQLVLPDCTRLLVDFCVTLVTIAFHPLYLPDFLAAELNSTDTLEEVRDRLQVKNWLTEGLVEEITQLFPSKDDIDPVTGTRDQSVFSHNCLKLFPTGRIFASDKQIEQASELFLDSWAIVKSHEGKKIMCHFGVSSKKKVVSIIDPLLQREHQSKKDSLQCPFKIMFSHQGKSVHRKKPGIFYRAKITTVVTEHTCGMSPMNMRIALQKTGQLEVNIEGMKDILSLLSSKPRVACNVLRPMMENYIPGWRGVSAQYVNNFRKRMLLFLLQNPDYQHLSYEQARALSSKKSIAADEMTGLDDPFINQNFTLLLRKIMQEDSDTWEALSLMDDLKLLSPGFDYRIKKDSSGKPIGLMYMTAQMRYHARRYGTVLCLDAQKRQYNSSGWPYIAPVVKDNKMKVAVIAESIVTEETHEFYIWIIRCIVDIEPRFHLNNINIIFADQKLTPSILEELGIESTCILRGDFYHLLNEVWPNHFHSSVYGRIKKFLRTMLLSTSQEEWDDSYQCGLELLTSSPRMTSALNAIYSNPEKYSGYFLRSIPGNLQMNGDVSAEQNHSGVVAYLGVGAAYSISEQMTHLLGRQRNLDKLRRQREDDQYVTGSRYESSYRLPNQSEDDVVAKKTFSGYAFKELWTRTIKRSFFLQSEIADDGSCIVWPTKHTKDNRVDESTTIIKEGSRCGCARQIAFLIQCEHEYVNDGGIDIYKFHHRHLHRQTFDRLHPGMASLFTHDANSSVSHSSNTGMIESEAINNEVAHDPQLNEPMDTSIDHHPDDDNFPPGVDETSNEANFEATTNRVLPTSNVVTYQCIVERAGELARTCQQEQSKMRSILCNINQMIDRVRDGKDIFIHFDTGSLEVNKENCDLNMNQPRPAISKAISNATGIKRMQSGREFHSRKGRKHRKNVNLSQVSNSNDDDHLNAAKPQTRACSICRQKKHGAKSCPRLTKFGAVALQKGNEQVRMTLSTGIGNISRFSLVSRHPDDSRSIFKEMPATSEIKAVVLHQRYFISSLLYDKCTSENICIETTILTTGGLEHPSYTKQLFKVDCISAYITRSKTNIIMSQLDGCVGQDNSFEYGNSLSQQLSVNGGEQLLTGLSQMPVDDEGMSQMQECDNQSLE